MQRSESIKALAKALVLAKSKMEAPHKNKTNPHFKSAYADLAAVKASYQPALGEAGLTIINALGLKDTVLTLTTVLAHADSGEWIASDYPIPAGLKPQEIGSAVSYGRRYNGSSLLDIVAEDDDDGNAAQAGTTKAPEKASAPAAQPPVKASVPEPPKKSELTQAEIMDMQRLSKEKGYPTVNTLAPILYNLTGKRLASELSKSEYVSVMDALKAMREKVPA